MDYIKKLNMAPVYCWRLIVLSLIIMGYLSFWPVAQTQCKSVQNKEKLKLYTYCPYISNFIII